MFSSTKPSVLKDSTNATGTPSKSSATSIVSSLFKRSKPDSSAPTPASASKAASPRQSYTSDTDASATSTSTPPTDTKQQQLTTQVRALLGTHVALTRQSFHLHATLGTGTFGRVRLVTYAAENHQTYTFALKILKKSEILRLKQVDHIKQEKQILSSINHPFIVILYHSFQDVNTVYMCMEYVCGGELFSQLRKVGRFSEQTARFYAAEIVLALSYLHDRDIVYRDLKPENLLIDKEGHIKITDFGFAKHVVDRTWTLCGTPEYLAPEIIQSKGHGRAVDWWALGVLIYEMLAGYPPFYDENPFGIYQKILQCKLEFPKHFSADAKDMIKRLLTLDRTKRIGCLVDGVEDIKQHKFFGKVDWVKVLHRKIKAPYIPHVAHANDTSNFDAYPDSDSEVTPKQMSEADRAVFDGF